MVEEPREQQPVAAAPPQQPAYRQVGPAYTQVPPDRGAPAASSAVDTAARVIRLLAGRAVWAVEQGWRVIEPRLGWVILTGLLASVIGLLSLLLVLPRLFAERPAPADLRVAALNPAPAVEDFLRGQETFDADLMWESFSDELRQTLEDREITRDTLAERAETERRAGLRYSSKYIGGVEVADRQTMYFYAVDVASSQEQGTMTFIFTVDRNGKIVNVE